MWKWETGTGKYKIGKFATHHPPGFVDDYVIFKDPKSATPGIKWFSYSCNK